MDDWTHLKRIKGARGRMTQKNLQLVFLPGASGSTSFWNPLIRHLNTPYTHKIIAYPGFADTPSDPEIQCFDDLQHYVLNQIEAPSILIAQSMGGIFAIAAALQKPDLVKGLVLIATSGGIDLKPFHVLDWRQAYQQQYINYPDWFVQTAINYEKLLSQIQLNILLLWGDSDLISPVAVGEYLQRHLKHAHLKVIQGGDHSLAKTHADQVAHYIDEYLLNNKQTLMDI